jgi:hypothetical protein
MNCRDLAKDTTSVESDNDTTSPEESVDPTMTAILLKWIAQRILSQFVELFNPRGQGFLVNRAWCEEQARPLVNEASSKIADEMWKTIDDQIGRDQSNYERNKDVEAGQNDVSPCLRVPLALLFGSLEKVFIEDCLQYQAQKLISTSAMGAVFRLSNSIPAKLRAVCRYEDMLETCYDELGPKIGSLKRFVRIGQVRYMKSERCSIVK